MNLIKRIFGKSELSWEWQELALVHHHTFWADIGRYQLEKSDQISIRLRRRDSNKSLELRMGEIRELLGLLLGTADEIADLPEIGAQDSRDMENLAISLHDTFEAIAERYLLGMGPNDPAAHALRALVNSRLEEEGRDFAVAPHMTHPYRQLLLLDRWLAGGSSYYSTSLDYEDRIDEFGACPLCCFRHGTNHLNVGSTHWFVCEELECAGVLEKTFFPIGKKKTRTSGRKTSFCCRTTRLLFPYGFRMEPNRFFAVVVIE